MIGTRNGQKIVSDDYQRMKSDWLSEDNKEWSDDLSRGNSEENLKKFWRNAMNIRWKSDDYVDEDLSEFIRINSFSDFIREYLSYFLRNKKIVCDLNKIVCDYLNTRKVWKTKSDKVGKNFLSDFFYQTFRSNFTLNLE